MEEDRSVNMVMRLHEFSDCRNRSQAGQDIFVLKALKWKREGTFLEIGANDPVLSSNTCLLSDEFGWRGIAIELDGSFAPKWAKRRPESVFIAGDATKMDWDKVLAGVTAFDYLSLDIDPPEATLAVLESLPLDRVRFSVITYEHDAWRGDFGPRERAREIFRKHGYVLAVPDVRVHVHYPYKGPEPVAFEDWHVCPQAVQL
jgi:hypothetical protein